MIYRTAKIFLILVMSA